MSWQSDAMPDFEPGSTNYYSPADLADMVLWPLVDKKWGDDWRAHSFVGNELELTRRGNDMHGTLDMQLKAYCQNFESDDVSDIDDPLYDPRLSTVSVTISRLLTDERKDMMLSLARGDNQRGIKSPLLNVIEDDDELTALSVTKYSIDTHGDLFVLTQQEIIDADGDPIWEHVNEGEHVDASDGDPEEVEEDDEDEYGEAGEDTMLLMDHDIELIESGLIVFNAPRSILRALQLIKSSPII